MVKKKNALILVFDKSGLDKIGKFLIKNNYVIYSTGGSSEYLKRNRIPHFQISKYTKQKEILHGRVKTLHPKIFGGILATNSKIHQKELVKEKMINFDLLIINLYPFKETIKKVRKEDEIIEMIDIGGHSLIRAAVKNYKKTIIIVDPSDYQNFIKNFPKTEPARKKYAIKAMNQITNYDIAISNWFQGIYYDKYPLRYGENPQQKATALIEGNQFKQLSGEKKLSYNNLLDLDAAVTIAYEIKTKKPDFISQQQRYCILNDEVGQESVYLLINKPSQPSKLLTKPVPQNCYYLIKNLVYCGSVVFKRDNAQSFWLKVRQNKADEQFLFLKFNTNTEYKEIDAIVFEIQMN